MTRTPKERLDKLLVQTGLAPTREKAQALILAGLVRIPRRPDPKAGDLLPLDIPIEIIGDSCPYVSRGGLKLKGALDHFQVRPKGALCLDIGASTGGFTDCLLKEGAVKVYALDVGTGQLDWTLRRDERVVNWEQTHVRMLTREMIPEEKVDLITIDVSFISLLNVIPHLAPFLTEGSALLAMVKPQFEVGPKRVGKGGVVREEALQQEAVATVASFLKTMGYAPEPPFPASIKGPKGNQEYFLHLPSRFGR